jgi:hypothetical protein
MTSTSRLRNIGWGMILLACIAIFAGLTFKVNAVKNEVRLAERRIVALQSERMLLETEFQTRANQQQLSNWNEVEFGFVAPRADQFIENERELAALGVPRSADAPEPIRVASAPRADDENLPFRQLADQIPAATGTTSNPRQQAANENTPRERLLAAAAAEMAQAPSNTGRVPLAAQRSLADGPIRIPIGNANISGARIAGGAE